MNRAPGKLHAGRELGGNVAGIFGIDAETMEQVDALQRLRADYPTGFPMVRPHVKAPALVGGHQGRQAVLARFGFSRRFSSFNARSDRLTTGKMWSRMFGTAHAIVPVSYVVEWVDRDEGRQPYLIRRADGRPLMAPALIGPYFEDRRQKAFAICTREPNAFFGAFHNRMIGACPEHLVDQWLAPEGVPHDELLECVAALPDEEMVAVPTAPEITKRRAGDWSALEATGDPVTWADVKAGGP